MKVSPRLVTLAVSLVLTPACSVPTAPGEDDPPLLEPGDPVQGQAAFLSDCASCHASRDGFDLAHFSFSDTTILRRAVAHVDTAVALDIVTYIRSLDVDTRSRGDRVFQPGGEILSDDVAFAQRLFGADAWPSDLTTAELRAMDPREVPVALSFPLWSDEESNLDWMPDAPFPDALLDWNDGHARALLQEYYRTSSVQDLINALQALVASDRDAANPDAPCVEGDERLRPADCFDARRWVSSFGAQFMLRHDLDGPVHHVLHDVWWDMGHVARRTVLSDGFEGQIPDALQNWNTWMYAGWAFEPDRHASFYLAAGLARAGMARHAMFHVLRAQVARMEESVAPYVDAANVPRYGEADWVYEGLRFAYRHLIERLDAGERPVGEITQARQEVNVAYNLAVEIVTAGQAETLASLRDEVLDRL